MSHRFSLAAWLAPLALSALSMTSAPAVAEPRESFRTLNCYGTRNMASCITTRRTGHFNPHVISMPAQTQEQVTAAAERDRRWVKRCDPVVRQDRYGMPRYSYSSSAPGCEYGRLD
jgi:hypothetical protein